MEFLNRQNESFTVDGKTYWISRSVAVVAIPVFQLPDKSLNIPVGVRSNSTPDHQGQIGLVCGYLDWDESGWGAVKRECWEEIGLDLDNLLPNISSVQPYFVQSDPEMDDRQNVTLRYRFLIEVKSLPDLKASAETSSVFWISNNELIDRNRFAFNHADLIEEAFEYFPHVVKGKEN
jgi:8-oxo-dGTP pyrophosphatase MutT (NUDIX family)